MDADRGLAAPTVPEIRAVLKTISDALRSAEAVWTAEGEDMLNALLARIDPDAVLITEASLSAALVASASDRGRYEAWPEWADKYAAIVLAALREANR